MKLVISVANLERLSPYPLETLYIMIEIIHQPVTMKTQNQKVVAIVTIAIDGGVGRRQVRSSLNNNTGS